MANGTRRRGKPNINMTQLSLQPRPSQLCLGLGLQDLAALIHSGLQIDVVWTTQFAGILVLHVSGPRERVGGAAHAAARWRGFSFRHSHGYETPENRDF